MRFLLAFLLAFLAGPAFASEAADCIPAHECSTVCNKGKTCGGSCIKFSFMCSKDPADWQPGMPCDSDKICTGAAAAAACGSVAPSPEPAGGVDFVAVAQPNWWEGSAGTAAFTYLADTWHFNGTWVWAEDVKYFAKYVWPELEANDRLEVIWLNMYGHQSNCGAPGIQQVDACGQPIFKVTMLDAAGNPLMTPDGCYVYDETSDQEWDRDHWPGGYDEATCELWYAYAWDTDGDGPDRGWPKKDLAYKNYGAGLGWLDIDPATGEAYARLLDACFDSGRCKIMLMDDPNGYSGPDDFEKQDAEDLSSWIKANLWPNAYTMLRKQPCNVNGPPLNTVDGKYHALDATTSMFYASGAGNPYGVDIDAWITHEKQCAADWGVDLIYDLSVNTGGLNGGTVEKFAPAMSAEEILRYGTALCAGTTVEVNVYQIGKTTDAAYLYWTRPDVSAAIEQVGALCRGGGQP